MLLNKLYLLLLLFASSGMVFPSGVFAQTDVDSATREVDRDMREEAEQKIRKFPKKPKIEDAEDEEVVNTDTEDSSEKEDTNDLE